MAQCFGLRIAVIFAKYSYAYLYPPRPPLKSGSLKFQAQTIFPLLGRKTRGQRSRGFEKGVGKGERDGSVIGL